MKKRGLFIILDRATWKDKFQWMHFIAPCLLATVNIWIM